MSGTASPPDPHIRHRRRPQTNESIRSQGSSRFRRRLHTWGSTRSSASQGSQGSQRTNSTSSASGGFVQNYYPCYGLDWETLKEYLMEVWPELDFEEPLSTDNDQFVFETPSPGLTEMDKVKIAGLRRKVLARRPSVSPERPSHQAA